MCDNSGEGRAVGEALACLESGCGVRGEGWERVSNVSYGACWRRDDGLNK